MVRKHNSLRRRNASHAISNREFNVAIVALGIGIGSVAGLAVAGRKGAAVGGSIGAIGSFLLIMMPE